MTDETIVAGTLLTAPPGGLQHRVVVPRCGGCGLPHLHVVAVGGDLTTLLRRPRCAPTRPYRVVITETLPAREVPRVA